MSKKIRNLLKARAAMQIVFAARNTLHPRRCGAFCCDQWTFDKSGLCLEHQREVMRLAEAISQRQVA